MFQFRPAAPASVSGAGIPGVAPSSVSVPSLLVPSGGDDTSNMMAMARATGGFIYLGPGRFRMLTPFKAEFYGRVPYGNTVDGALKAPKFIGSGREGVTTIDTSALAGQSAIQVDGTLVAEAQNTGVEPYKTFFFGFTFVGISMAGPGAAGAVRDTCAIQLGGYSYEGQVTEQTRIDADFVGYTTAIRGDDTTGLDVSSCRFTHCYIDVEGNYNVDLFRASRAYSGFGYPGASNVAFVNGSPNITLPTGLANVWGGPDRWNSMLMQARASNGTGAQAIPIGTRLLSYNSVTGAAVMSKNATLTGNCLVSLTFGIGLCFRNALTLGGVALNAGSKTLTIPSNGSTTLNWTVGVKVGQPVRVQTGGIGGTKPMAFSLAARVESIVDGQAITVTEASSLTTTTGQMALRDPYGLWEPKTAFPMGGFANQVLIDQACWFMHKELVFTLATGGGVSFDDNYLEGCAGVYRVGWEALPALPSGFFVRRNHFSIFDQLAEPPMQVNNRFSGQDAQWSCVVAGNYSSAQRGSPTTGGVQVSWLRMIGADGSSNQAFEPAVGRSRFTWRENFLPLDAAAVNAFQVDFGNAGTGWGLGKYRDDSDSMVLSLGGFENGNMVIRLSAGVLANWYAPGTDVLYCELTGSAQFYDWLGSYPPQGRRLKLVVKQNGNNNTLQLPGQFYGNDGATQLGVIGGAGTANKFAVLEFVHMGNNKCRLTEPNVVWQSV